MKASDLLIGAAIVAVGYLAWRAMRPAPAPTTSTTGGRGILETFAGKLGDTVNTRFNEALDGQREWW